MIRGYFYRGEGGLNFGDALNPLLFRRLIHRTLEWVPPADASLFAIGSNIELVPDGFRGTIFGTGIMRSNTRRDLSGANILAVRGNLTAACCGIGPVLLADPGLLAAHLIGDRPKPDIAHGFIRHFADRRRVAGYPIDVLAGPEFVVREAARCRRITTSSLHGLVLADTLGIPSRWSPHRAVTTVKFEDYASAYDEDIRPYRERLPDASLVAAKRDALLGAMRSLA